MLPIFSKRTLIFQNEVWFLLSFSGTDSRNIRTQTLNATYLYIQIHNFQIANFIIKMFLSSNISIFIIYTATISKILVLAKLVPRQLNSRSGRNSSCNNISKCVTNKLTMVTSSRLITRCEGGT